MKKSSTRAFMLLGLAEALFGSTSTCNEGHYREPRTLPKKEYELPKGVKEFHFTKEGELTDKENAFWSCVAINLQNAKRKFKKAQS